VLPGRPFIFVSELDRCFTNIDEKQKYNETYHSLLQKKSKAGIHPILILKIDIKNINPMKPSL
jgi:hypothetical protein